MYIAPHINIDEMSEDEYDVYQTKHQDQLERQEENELDISRGVWEQNI